MNRKIHEAASPDVELTAMDCAIMDDIVTHRATGDPEFLDDAQAGIEGMLKDEYPERVAIPRTKRPNMEEFVDDLLEKMAERLGLDPDGWHPAGWDHVDPRVDTDKEKEAAWVRQNTCFTKPKRDYVEPRLKEEEPAKLPRIMTPDNKLVKRLAAAIGVKPYQVAAAVNGIEKEDNNATGCRCGQGGFWE